MQSFIRTLLAFTVPGALPVKGYSRFGDGDEAGKRSRGSEHFQTLERGIYNNTTTSLQYFFCMRSESGKVRDSDDRRRKSKDLLST